MPALPTHRNLIRLVLPAVAVLLVASCGSRGPVRRISEPAASLQQLTVRADGRWEVQLRLNNYSSMAMRFTGLSLNLALDNGTAAHIRAQPDLEVGPESADVQVVTVAPTSAGMARVATALADGRGLDYTLEGSLQATPDGAGSKSWTVKTSSALSPVPGLAGTLR